MYIIYHCHYQFIVIFFEPGFVVSLCHDLLVHAKGSQNLSKNRSSLLVLLDLFVEANHTQLRHLKSSN